MADDGASTVTLDAADGEAGEGGVGARPAVAKAEEEGCSPVSDDVWEVLDDDSASTITLDASDDQTNEGADVTDPPTSATAAVVDDAAGREPPGRRARGADAGDPSSPPTSSSPARRLGDEAQVPDSIMEAHRIMAAKTPAEVFGIDSAGGACDPDQLQRAWKRLVFALHPDRLSCRSKEDRAAAAAALAEVHQAKARLCEQAEAAGAVSVPEPPVADGKPVCTKNSPGQRHWECKWQIPEEHDPQRPVNRYEVHGPRVFTHMGEPVEWVLLATLRRLDSSFVFVEDSPSQSEVMQAADRVRVAAVPLRVYACNGRGRSEPLYIKLPWRKKFPWLQGSPSMLCRWCGAAQLRPEGDARVHCVSCGAALSPPAAVATIRCNKCAGEALWDADGARLDCRLCGRNLIRRSS